MEASKALANMRSSKGLAPAPGPARTCVGCGEADIRANLSRFVLGEGEAGQTTVFFDARGSSFGHGAHSHTSRACISRATKHGFQKAFRQQVDVSETDLVRQIDEQLSRRLSGFLVAARRARSVTMGLEDVLVRLGTGRPSDLIIVAVDAGASVASPHPVSNAIASGRAFAWSTKQEIGALLGAKEVSICLLEDARIATAFRQTFLKKANLNISMGSEACRSPEVQ